MQVDRQRQYEDDRSVSLEHQRVKLEETIAKEAEEINRVEVIAVVRQTCFYAAASLFSSHFVTLDECKNFIELSVSQTKNLVSFQLVKL